MQINGQGQRSSPGIQWLRVQDQGEPPRWRKSAVVWHENVRGPPCDKTQDTPHGDDNHNTINTSSVVARNKDFTFRWCPSVRRWKVCDSCMRLLLTLPWHCSSNEFLHSCPNLLVNISNNLAPSAVFYFCFSCLRLSHNFWISSVLRGFFGGRCLLRMSLSLAEEFKRECVEPPSHMWCVVNTGTD